MPPLVLLALAVLACFCYFNFLGNDFCDDGVPIVALNPLVQEPNQWREIWTTDYWYLASDATPNRDLLYRPAALTSYRIVRALAGAAPLPQLIVNVLLHALVSVLVALLAVSLGGSVVAASAAGAVFAVLPIHSEVIANVVGRADMLAAAGMLVTLLFHRRIILTSALVPRASWMLAAACAAFLTLAAKESGLAVLAIVPLFHALWARPSERHAASRSPAHHAKMLAYLLIPAAAYFALRYNALDGHLFQKPALTKTINVLVDAPPWQHALGVVQLWGMYWAKTFWPVVLTVNYSINAIRLATSPLDPMVLLGLATTIILIAAAARAWRRGNKLIALLVAALIISYAPTANALALIQVFFAERIWYLPSIWVCMLIGLAFSSLPRRPAINVIAALLLVGMTARCWIRNAEWRNNLTLYAAAHRDHPDGVGALRLYGQELANVGELEKSIALLSRAVEIDPGFTDAQRSLGHAYLNAGNFEAALHHLLVADMQIPGHPLTERTLDTARARVVAGTADEVAQACDLADAAPSNSKLAIECVRMLRQTGQLDQALTRCAGGSFASVAPWHHECAVTLVMSNQLDRAVQRYDEALALEPNNEVAVEMAMLLLERRMGDDLARALRLADGVLAEQPENPAALICKAELLALQGNLDAAGDYYRRAFVQLPPGSAQRRMWEQRARALGQ